MIHDTIREKLEQSPFVPFLVRASNGQAYKVADPSLVVLMKTKMFIAEARSDRSATIPYLHLHIACVEETGNGHPHRSRPRRNRP